jgi:hypothetical protein
MFSLKRVFALANRSFVAPIFPKVSFLPISEDVHPAFRAHYIHLQDMTSLPFPGKVLHVINRIPIFLQSYSYIAEVEGLFSLLPKKITRGGGFSCRESIRLIEAKLTNGKLRRIIFQSQPALELDRQWMTSKIEEASRVVPLIPVDLHPRTVNDAEVLQASIRILIVGRERYRKGLFLLPHIIPKVRESRPDIQFTCVSSEPIPELEGVDGLNVIVVNIMSEECRRQIFTSHHYLLNLSIGDALGIFIDSLRFNIPMIGFPGKHGAYYVPPGSGILIQAPLFEFEGSNWDRQWSIRSFPAYIEAQYRVGLFDATIAKIIDTLVAVDLGPGYEAMCRFQYNFSVEKLGVQQWLQNWRVLYEEIDL